MPQPRRTTVAVSTLTAVVIATGIQARSTAARQTGTISHAGLVAGELVAGTMLALGGAVGLGLVGSQTIGPQGGEDPGLQGAVLGAAVGTTLGAAAGVALVGRAAADNPRFNHALAGSALGMGLFFLARPTLGLDPDYPAFWISWFAFPVVGAVLGTHLPDLPRIGRSTGRLRLHVTPAIDRSVPHRAGGGIRIASGMIIEF